MYVCVYMQTEMLAELAKRDVDVYVKATAVEGMKSSLSTDYIMKMSACASLPRFV